MPGKFLIKTIENIWKYISFFGFGKQVMSVVGRDIFKNLQADEVVSFETFVMFH